MCIICELFGPKYHETDEDRLKKANQKIDEIGKLLEDEKAVDSITILIVALVKQAIVTATPPEYIIEGFNGSIKAYTMVALQELTMLKHPEKYAKSKERAKEKHFENMETGDKVN